MLIDLSMALYFWCDNFEVYSTFSSVTLVGYEKLVKKDTSYIILIIMEHVHRLSCPFALLLVQIGLYAQHLSWSFFTYRFKKLK